MELYLIKMFGISLVLTLFIEILIAALWGLKSKREITLVVLANILTNPAAVLLAWLGSLYIGMESGFILQILIEVIVVIVEAKVYLMFSKTDGWNVKNPLMFAVIANAVSWFSGVLLQYVT